MFYPNSKNAFFTLIKIVNLKDNIGVLTPTIISEKKVYGIIKSITNSEYQTNILINKNIELKLVLQGISYDNSKFILFDNSIYKIERTYINGNFIELYLSLSDYKLEELKYAKSVN